jgi:hypothetical protein
LCFAKWVTVVEMFSWVLLGTELASTPPTVVDRGLFPPEQRSSSPRVTQATLRLNHFLVKERGEHSVSREKTLPVFYQRLLELAHRDACVTLGLEEVYRRYCFVTIDEREVNAGFTQRNPGFHVDGQNISLVEPQEIDVQYVWCDALPTEFALGRWRLEDATDETLFEVLEKQVSADTPL